MAAANDQLAWDFSFPAIEGGTLDFRTFTGRALLVVNTASFCGYTYQYEQLEKLHAAVSPSAIGAGALVWMILSSSAPSESHGIPPTNMAT